MESGNLAPAGTSVPSSHLFAPVYDTAGVAVTAYTTSGKLVYLNEAMTHLSGYGEDELCSFFASPFLRGESEASIFASIAAGDIDSESLVKECHNKAGIPFKAHITFYSLRDDSGCVTHVVRLARKVSSSSSEFAVIPKKRRDKAYAALQLISQVVLQEYDLAGLMEGVHRTVRALMPAENFLIALTDGPGTTISFPYFVDIRRPQKLSRTFGNSLIEHIYNQEKSLILQRQAFASFYALNGIEVMSPLPESWVGVPLRTHSGSVIGVLCARTYWEGDRYTPEDVQLLELVSSHVAGAIESFRQKDELRASEARFRAVFENSGLGVAVLSRDGVITECNRHMETILGFTESELQESVDNCFVNPDDLKEARKLLSEMKDGKRDHFVLVKELACKNGTTIWGKQTVTGVRSSANELMFAVVILEDITEHKLADDRLMHMAFHDGLTGLPNRTLFMDRLEGAIRRAKRSSTYRFALLFMDMDRFKIVNDSMGHKAGDDLLQRFAKRVSGCLREGDTLARFGGDEFAVLLDGVESPLDASLVVERILDVLDQPFMIEDVAIHSGASIGAVLNGQHYLEADKLIRDADSAMYRAKQAGAGRYEIFDKHQHEQVQGLLQLENSIRAGITERDFELHFQPYVSLHSGIVRGAEGLARWDAGTDELVYPKDFIPLAEDSGLIFELDCLMLAKGCKAALAVQQLASSNPFTLNVNVSSRSLQQWNLLDNFLQIIDESNCDPRQICLEITENTLMNSADLVTDRLWKLKERGVKLALDDFGTGYSSFNYLRRFPLDMIKIDRCFTSRVHDELAAYGIVQSMVHLGRGLNIDVVAEGVETPEQVDVLKELGCLIGQGYLYSRPLDFDRFTKIIERQSTLPLIAG